VNGTARLSQRCLARNTGCRVPVRRLVVAGLLLILQASLAGAGSLPENAVVVVNADSWASTRIANEYVRLRGIPPANVIYLSGLTDFEHLEIEQFRQQILLPVLKTIEGRGLAGQIDYVLYSADFPTAISVSGDVGDRKLSRVITPVASINGLTYLYQLVLAKDLRYLDLGCNRYARRVVQQSRDTAWTAEEQRKFDEAAKVLAELAGRGRDKSKPEAKAVEGEAGKQPRLDALQVLRELTQAHPHASELLYNLACGLAQAGNPDEAVATLKAAVQAGWWNHRHAARDADLKTLRERADFKELLGKMQEQRFDLEPSVGFSAVLDWPAGSGARYLLSTMLACTSGRGNSVSEALAYLRRSAAADGTSPQGTIYLLQNGDVRSTTREWAFRGAIEQLQRLGVNAVVESGVLPQHKPDVAGAVVGSAGFEWSKCGSTILPGAICEHLTSCGGELPETAGQTPLTEFLRYGAAGASGTVTEPFAIQAKFPTPFIHLYYARGCTLGEAFYQSLAGPYQLLIVGDALCKPWAPKIDVRVDGLRPHDPVRDTIKITPQASTIGDAAPVLVELYVNGRRVAQVQPGQSLDLDTKQLPDGWHEFTLGTHSSNPVNPQGRLVIPVVVANGAEALQVSGPGAAEIAWDKPFELQATLPGAREIVFVHNTRPIARIAGPQGRVTVDPRTLGQGPVRLQPLGLIGGETVRPVLGQPLELTIIPPPPLPAIETPPEQERTAGFRVTVPDKTPAVVERIAQDLLASAGLEQGRSFTLEAYFHVPDDDVYQFQIRGHADIRGLWVDGKPQDWPRGTPWWFVPVHLAKGAHQLRIEGQVAERPDIEIRFGGYGTQRLDAKRQTIWTCQK
jgi:hypothetical protein